MKKIISLLFVIALMMTTGRAQTLFMSRDIKTAFDNETRSPDGKPGKNYWQNHGHYTIDMTVMPPNRNVQGKESIVYFNNSPDTLQGLNFKLFLNIHKPGAPRDGGALDDYLTSGIHIDKFLINGEEQDVN
nr:M1 family peptidase [Chitinophagaceae bacterium]